MAKVNFVELFVGRLENIYIKKSIESKWSNKC